MMQSPYQVANWQAAAVLPHHDRCFTRDSTAREPLIPRQQKLFRYARLGFTLLPFALCRGLPVIAQRLEAPQLSVR
jgi:hypothetical protein